MCKIVKRICTSDIRRERMQRFSEKFRYSIFENQNEGILIEGKKGIKSSGYRQYNSC